MALQINDDTAVINRTTNVIGSGADWTRMVWYKPTFTPPNLPANYITVFTVTNVDYTKWAGVYGYDDGYNLDVDSTLFPASNFPDLEEDRGFHICHKKSGNTHFFYLDGVLVSSGTKNISADVLVELLLGQDRFSLTTEPLQFREFREWDVSLSITGILAEMQSRTAVRTADLQTDCPLVDDLNDISGNDNHFSGTGNFEFVADVAPPANADGDQATEITSGDITYEQTVDDDWRSWWVYYRYKNNTAVDQVMSLAIWGEIGVAEVPWDGVYRPYVNIYHGTAPILNTDILPSTRRVFQLFKNGSTTVPIPAGVTYQIQVRVGGAIDGGGNASSALLRLKFKLGPAVQGAEGGLVFIRAASFSGITNHEDVPIKGLPAAFINPATGVIAGFIPQFPTGESGDVQRAAKKFVFADENADVWEPAPPPNPTFSYWVYQVDENYNIINKVAWESSIAPPSKNRTHLPSERVYLIGGKTGGGGTNYSYVDTDGTLGPIGNIPHAQLASGFISAIAVNNAENVMYVGVPLGGSSEQGKIKRWNLTTPGFGTDVAALVANHQTTDLLVMPDDTIVALYYKGTTTKALFIRQFSAAGATLQTITPSLAGTLGDTAPRLGYSPVENAVWLLNHYDDSRNHSRLISLTDQSVLKEAITPNILGSEEEREDPDLPMSSDSCPIIEAGVVPIILPVDCICCCPETPPTKVPPKAPTTWNPGAVVEPLDPGEWDAQCEGPGDVPTAADPTDSEIWVS